MATSFKMPQLGETVVEGTITRWLKQEGETVEADEALVEVSTDKDREAARSLAETRLPDAASAELQRLVREVMHLVGDETENGPLG